MNFCRGSFRENFPRACSRSFEISARNSPGVFRDSEFLPITFMGFLLYCGKGVACLAHGKNKVGEVSIGMDENASC